MALAPEAVEMSRLTENNTWYTKSAKNSSLEKGERNLTNYQKFNK